ncbi:hypothetical protein NVP1121O_131 [Vibrio phage 1.121.O._10N.286.46.C4]|nr:hypothetical protein NVP1121O_131 [Vibrio phage 1.121.O._10N.286.46.C4]
MLTKYLSKETLLKISEEYKQDCEVYRSKGLDKEAEKAYNLYQRIEKQLNKG